MGTDAAESVCALMRQALDAGACPGLPWSPIQGPRSGGAAAALPCAVLGDVLRAR